MIHNIIKYGFFLWLLIIIHACQRGQVEVIHETYKSGSPKIIRYYENENDSIPVREIHYYENGQLKLKGEYESGKRTGTWTFWYQNGNIWSTGEYTKGLEHGKKTVYHENGKKYYEGTLHMGKRTGVWKFWDEEGKLIKSVNYDNKKPM